MDADAVRNEKVKVLRSLEPFSSETVHRDVVRAQYAVGPARDRGYLDEEGVAAGSTTESYVAIRAGIHNWRWNGVPFFLRSGKCLHGRYSEVVLRFRKPPINLFEGPVHGGGHQLRPNDLHMLIQPTEGFRLGFMVKAPGPGDHMRHADFGLDYHDLEAGPSAPAYQRLLLDALEGNATLFIRGDETEAAWRWVDTIRAGWDGDEPPPVHTYPAGSPGPEAANALFHDQEGTWGTGSA